MCKDNVCDDGFGCFICDVTYAKYVYRQMGSIYTVATILKT